MFVAMFLRARGGVQGGRGERRLVTSVGVAARLGQAEIIVEHVARERRVAYVTVGYSVVDRLVVAGGCVVFRIATAVRITAAVARRTRRAVVLFHLHLLWRRMSIVRRSLDRQRAVWSRVPIE